MKSTGHYSDQRYFLQNDKCCYVYEGSYSWRFETVWKEKVSLEETEEKGIDFGFEIVGEPINEPKN